MTVNINISILIVRGYFKKNAKVDFLLSYHVFNSYQPIDQALILQVKETLDSDHC